MTAPTTQAAVERQSLGEKLAVASANDAGLSAAWADCRDDVKAEFERIALTFAASLSHDETASAVIAAHVERIKELEQNDRDYRDLIIHLRNTADSFRDDSGDVVASEVIVRIDRALSASPPAAPSLPASEQPGQHNAIAAFMVSRCGLTVDEAGPLAREVLDAVYAPAVAEQTDREG